MQSLTGMLHGPAIGSSDDDHAFEWRRNWHPLVAQAAVPEHCTRQNSHGVQQYWKREVNDMYPSSSVNVPGVNPGSTRCFLKGVTIAGV
jgi:hypothetical protein